MKAVILLLLLFSFNISIAQEVADEPPGNVSTTEEEYNYLTKGYKAQVIDQGGDLKRGYSLEQIDNKMKVNNFTFGMWLFKRDASKEYCGVLVTAKSAASGKTYYFCIPYNNPALSKKYFDAISELDYTFAMEYTKLVSSFLPDLLSSYFKHNK